ncbi:DUF2155 domain-containing protein [Qingshengfaniella alkalisoli]|uniref:DUF2155 domain-containing protein n=1 Tax=Qingshengfaniella alkalisoli TaxID=2599296 RepID=A0A5B8J1Y2_9RHOB|nr:DUF2155 domain-containing protein [Qingshengfaniella alkalisoli]QDY68507.1 DUF2155 domain-containing protein [Qingshengfaniella alkalisoli]
MRALTGFVAMLLASTASAQEVTSAGGATLRGLDRLSGELTDLDVAIGETVEMGRLTVRLEDCRYPTENPSGDAFAYLVIEDTKAGAQLFDGWMVASSPALNALDHMRYDVWVIRCKTA